MSSEEMIWWFAGIAGFGVLLSQIPRLYRIALHWAEDHDVLVAKHVVWALPQAGSHGLDMARILVLVGVVILVWVTAGLSVRSYARAQARAALSRAGL